MVLVANITRQGRAKLLDEISDKVAGPIRFFWRANLKNNQGYLRDSIEQARNDDNIQVYSREKVLKFLEYGTEPHIIEPKNAEALRWFNETGEPVFARKVRHPGTDPQAALRSAIDRVRTNANQ